MQALLSAQPDMQSFPETQYFLYLPRNPESGVIPERLLNDLIAGLSRHIRISAECSDAARDLCRMGKLEQKGFFELLVKDQLQQQVVDKPVESLRWIEKSGTHAYHMETILKHYPQARFIRTLRNPLHSFASRRSIHPNANSGWGEGWRPVENYADEWLAMIRSTENFQLSHPDRMLTVKLENLASDPATVVSQVCEFASIDFDASSLNTYRDNAAPLFGEGNTWKHPVAQQPISASIANRENAPGLTAYEKFRVAQLIGGMMSHYGFPIDAECPRSLNAEEIGIVIKTVDFYRSRPR
jgi:hypothetical protein